jgi:hypothetical protein
MPQRIPDGLTGCEHPTAFLEAPNGASNGHVPQDGVTG